MPACMSAVRGPYHCWRCCAVLQWKPRARRLACSAMIWLPKLAFFSPASRTLACSWQQPSCIFYCLFGYDRRALELFEDLWTITIFVKQKFVGDVTEPLREFGRQLLGVRARVLAVYGTHGIYVLLN